MVQGFVIGSLTALKPLAPSCCYEGFLVGVVRMDSAEAQQHRSRIGDHLAHRKGQEPVKNRVVSFAHRGLVGWRIPDQPATARGF